MGFDIIKDLEKGTAAIVDAVNGRALGPLLTVEGDAHRAELILDQFVTAVGGDPSTLPQFKLEGLWDQFREAILADEDQAPAAPLAEAASTVPGEPAAVGAATTVNVETAAGPGGEQVSPEEAAARAEPVIPPAETAVPGAPADTDMAAQAVPAAGEQVCPTCDGWRTIAVNGVVEPCPTCGGRGVIADPTPA